MILELPFVHAALVRHRGRRTPLRVAVLDRSRFEVAELEGGDAPVALLRDARDGLVPIARAWGGRVMSVEGSEVARRGADLTALAGHRGRLTIFGQWSRRMQPGRARDGDAHPLREVLEGRNRQGPVAELLWEDRDAAMSEAAAAYATRLAFVDGRAWSSHAWSEPTWRLTDVARTGREPSSSPASVDLWHGPAQGGELLLPVDAHRHATDFAHRLTDSVAVGVPHPIRVADPTHLTDPTVLLARSMAGTMRMRVHDASRRLGEVDLREWRVDGRWSPRVRAASDACVGAMGALNGDPEVAALAVETWCALVEAMPDPMPDLLRTDSPFASNAAWLRRYWLEDEAPRRAARLGREEARAAAERAHVEDVLSSLVL